jgi:hypothetical protein
METMAMAMSKHKIRATRSKNMRMRCMTLFVLSCFGCSIIGCSARQDKEEEVAYWLKSWPTTSRGLKPHYHTSWYPSWDEWIEAGRKIEGIEPVLIRFLENNTIGVPSDVICDALGFVGSEDSLPVLKSVIADHRNRDATTRKAAARALAEIGGPGAVEILYLTASGEQDPTVKYTAIAALAHIGDPKAIAVIEDELKSLRTEQKALELMLEELKSKESQCLGTTDQTPSPEG